VPSRCNVSILPRGSQHEDVVRAMVQEWYLEADVETSGRGGRGTLSGPSLMKEMLRAFATPTALWRQHL